MTDLSFNKEELFSILNALQLRSAIVGYTSFEEDIIIKIKEFLK